MLTVNLKPAAKDLRQFSYISLAGFPLLAWVLVHVTLGLPPAVVFAVAGIGPVVLILGMVHPKLVWPVYVGMMLIAIPIGFVVSAVLLRLIYYLLFTPIALWFRLTGKDAMHRRLDSEADSYWTEHKTRRDPASYLRLY